MWGTDWTRAVKLLTYKQGVDSFRVTDRLSEGDRATLMGGTLSLRGLPHFTLDSYRAHLRQVDLLEPDKLRRVVSYLVRIGWAKWVSTDEFTFLRPFCRVFERCLELSEHSPDRAEESAEGLSESEGTEGGENA